MLVDNLTKNHPIQFLARSVVGLLFIISAGFKIVSPADSASLFNYFLPNQPGLAYTLTIILSLFELLLGVTLIASFKLHYAAALSSLFFLVSTMLGLIFLNDPIDCGCFGSFVESKTDEFFLLRNFLFFFISLYVFKVSLETERQS